MSEKTPQRLTFDIDRDLHKKIKHSCVDLKVSMRKFILAAIEEKLKQLKTK